MLIFQLGLYFAKSSKSIANSGIRAAFFLPCVAVFPVRPLEADRKRQPDREGLTEEHISRFRWYAFCCFCIREKWRCYY